MTAKLCQLIGERNIYDEISEEIKELVDHVDINYQTDQGNTALHIAAGRKDLKCIEFLNQFGPNRNIKNKDGETPDAMLIKMITIGSHLLSSEVINQVETTEYHELTTIEEKFIREFSFKTFDVELSEKLKNDPAFKVLKITNVPNIQDFLQKLDEDIFGATIDETSHLFMVVIIVDENFHLNLFETLSSFFTSIARPFIIQIGSLKQKPIIYYKKTNEMILQRVFNL